ncbi:MAG: helix-hairpin-helix domain-containing protein [Bacteroidia bacterium]|jgi:DNA uptake protein ComE-like DNA-binding protein
MKTRRIENLIKSYFYFNRHERRGIVWLLVLMILTFIAPRVYTAKIAEAKFPIEWMDLKTIDLETPTMAEPKQLKKFDPNNATTQQWQTLGLSEKEIRRIQNYTKAGGKFKQASDLQKLYGVDQKKIEQALPFMVFPTKKLFTDSSTKRKSAQVVELNSTDSVQLVSLYRIGPALTHRILEYRDKLGGFLELEQLREVWGFDEDILYDLSGKITVNPSLAKRWELNTVSLEVLKTHPYFKYKLSNAIINYRNQHGPFQALADLKKIVLVTDSVYEKITKYIYLR